MFSVGIHNSADRKPPRKERKMESRRAADEPQFKIPNQEEKKPGGDRSDFHWA